MLLPGLGVQSALVLCRMWLRGRGSEVGDSGLDGATSLCARPRGLRQVDGAIACTGSVNLGAFLALGKQPRGTGELSRRHPPCHHPRQSGEVTQLQLSARTKLHVHVRRGVCFDSETTSALLRHAAIVSRQL